MTATLDRTESIFAAAVALTGSERSAYVDQACADSPELRARVEALLRAHDRAGHLLDRPVPGGLDQTGAFLPSEQPGAVIAGRYKLLEAIGEGGMGTVWVAEQTEPVRRKVALKLIKAGMDSRSVLARFEAERQALAVMDHPNIAKVLDGGIAESGRPFFVMEYVKGVPITEYCDAMRLSVSQRLELFVQVCQAVQHAHQKGIIHRDLKPSNILVAPYDDRPVPKVIDFGLAKAMHQSLTERTLHTAHETVLGTPLYMSPEQAQLNNLDVDTRSDVYSLGVLLYELLTGTTPLEKQRFKAAAWDEIKRIIREEEPPRPSTRLSSAQTLASLAAGRQTEPARLTKQVRGDLDWIVMKALEKDRARRYDTPITLARDIQRYLADEIVEARPPSASYRLRKFARKHRALLTTAAAFAALLLAAAAASSWLAVRARRAEATAQEKRIEAEQNAAKAEENAKQAEHNADALWEQTELHQNAVFDAEFRSLGLQIDLNLAELQTDPKVGLLRLASPLKHVFGPMQQVMPFAHATVTMDVGEHPRFVGLRGFAAMAVLASGQEYAPLLPPITHDGQAVAITSLSPNNETLLSLGTDHTARLWDARTAQPIAILRRGDEQVVNCGYSPDGRTVFTDDLTGVARLWDVPSGQFRAATEAQPNRYEISDLWRFGSGWKFGYDEREVCKISGNRLLTRRFVARKRDDGMSHDLSFEGPVELWDTATGRLVARLDSPGCDYLRFQFLKGGRWITTLEGRSTLLVFSAEDGRLTRLSHPEEEVVDDVDISPSDQHIATMTRGPGDFVNLRVWDTETWQAGPVTTPAKSPGSPGLSSLRFWMDDDARGSGMALALGADDGSMVNRWTVYRYGQSEPVAEFSGPPVLPDLPGGADDLAHGGNGWVYSTQTWQRLLPPPGRKFHPDLARFAKDGRFVPAAINSAHVLIDTSTDKAISTSTEWRFLPEFGMVATATANDQTTIRLIPMASRLTLPEDMLELWAQVAVRGELNQDGQFVKWNEPTWERKRQQLAAVSAPSPDVPFPGYVATDRLHWLRREFEEAKSNADKHRLARELLHRAESTGNRDEAVRWRTVVEESDPATEH